MQYRPSDIWSQIQNSIQPSHFPEQQIKFLAFRNLSSPIGEEGLIPFSHKESKFNSFKFVSFIQTSLHQVTALNSIINGRNKSTCDRGSNNQEEATRLWFQLQLLQDSCCYSWPSPPFYPGTTLYPKHPISLNNLNRLKIFAFSWNASIAVIFSSGFHLFITFSHQFFLSWQNGCFWNIWFFNFWAELVWNDSSLHVCFVHVGTLLFIVECYSYQFTWLLCLLVAVRDVILTLGYFHWLIFM